MDVDGFLFDVSGGESAYWRGLREAVRGSASQE
jgi:hypothetical protein